MDSLGQSAHPRLPFARKDSTVRVKWLMNCFRSHTLQMENFTRQLGIPADAPIHTSLIPLFNDDRINT